MSDNRPEYHPLPPGSYMPHRPNPHFVGREPELQKLAHLAQTTGGIAAVHAQAGLTGLGGIGKTQLAIEFAHRYGRLFPGGVFWVPCASPDLVTSMIARCAGPDGLNWPDMDHLKQPEVVGRVKTYWQSGPPCLLIFDNCEEPEILEQFAPVSGRAFLLLTSRKTNWQAVQAIPLEVLTPAESQQLLQTLAPHLTSAEADQVAEQLGHFPLALELAGHYLAFLRQAGAPLPVPDYVAQLQQKQLEHDSLKGWVGLKSPTKHELHVYATFLLSYEPLQPQNNINHLARQMLWASACLAPGAPIELAWLRPLWAEETEMMVGVALNRLLELGLVSQPAAGQLTLHRLVGQFVQGEVDPAVYHPLELKVAELIWDKAGEINGLGLPKLFEPLLPHAKWLAGQMTSRGELEMSAWLWNSLGYHYHINGLYPLAHSAYTQAVQLAEEGLDTDDRNLAIYLNNLGQTLQEMGDLDGAKEYAERALAIDEQVYEETHPKLAIRFNNLGVILKRIGDLAGAKEYMERALAIDQQIYEESHPKLAIRFNNLGNILKEMGDLEGAMEYVERALIIDAQLYEENHPAIARDVNNLGQILKGMGDLVGAKGYIEQALTILEGTLGENHPYTQKVRGNLTGIVRQLNG